MTGADLFFLAGFGAIAGFPLANGSLPVCVPQLGEVVVSQATWESYWNTCQSERLTKQAAEASTHSLLG